MLMYEDHNMSIEHNSSIKIEKTDDNLKSSSIKSEGADDNIYTSSIKIEADDNIYSASIKVEGAYDNLYSSAIKIEKSDDNLNSPSTSTKLTKNPRKYTWAEEVSREEIGLDDSRSCSRLNSSNESGPGDQEQKYQIVKTEVTAEPSSADSEDREISIDFLDTTNEQKYERLIKAEKLKTPFKRRHSNTPSNNSGSNSPNSTNSDNNMEVGSNTAAQEKNGHKSGKRFRRVSCNSSSSSSSYTESDPAILTRRQKQIEYGKNTVAYDRYVELIPKSGRTRTHPRTPNKYGKYSRRAFDGLIKIWRKQLHYYDPPTEVDMKVDVNESDDSDME